MTEPHPIRRPDLLVIVNNHFDLAWRRCFERKITHRGATFVSYADLQEYYILDNLDLASELPAYKFEIECAAVAEKFLERHPDRLGELRRLSQEGRLYIPGAGNNIIDSNLVHGESIVRNFVSGILWVEGTLGQRTRMGYRADAFGNSAQLPQILRGCGLHWVAGLFYVQPEGRYWRGLDGSVVLHSGIPVVGSAGGTMKYAPCPDCQGNGTREGVVCSCCAGRGIHDRTKHAFPSTLRLDPRMLAEHPCAFIHAGGEELLPDRSLFDLLEDLKTVAQPRFAVREDAFPWLREALAHAGDADESSVSLNPELNPIHTGCYVSRIKTKQNLRRQEYLLLAVDALAAMCAAGGSARPRSERADAWKRLFFTMFHDAVTGTHVDAAYREIEDAWRFIDSAAGGVFDDMIGGMVREGTRSHSILNLTGSRGSSCVRIPLPPTYTGATVSSDEPGKVRLVGLEGEEASRSALVLVRDMEPYSSLPVFVENGPAPGGCRTTGIDPVIQNGRFRIVADEHGLLSIYDKRQQREIAVARGCRPAEFVLEHDEGSPWATLSPDRKRTYLAESTTLTRTTKSDGLERLSFGVVPDSKCGYVARGLHIDYEVTLVEGLDRVEFRAVVSWDTYNHRLRVAMPVPIRGRHLYEIPYGVLERRPYEPTYGWSSANGDWPAVNWAGVADGRGLIALLNRGLPSYCMEEFGEDGTVIYLSVLRSPSLPTYLHEPCYYSMTDWDGMRDTGCHVLEYALSCHDGESACADAVRAAEVYNAGLRIVPGEVAFPPVPRVLSRNVRIGSMKPAENGDAVIVRLVEMEGTPTAVDVHLPAYVKNVLKTNLLERDGQERKVTDGRVRIELRGFEIATLRLELG